MLVNGVPLLDPMGIRIGDHKTLIRSLETVSIGVGGDSVVRVVDGRIHIGPDRLGMAMAYGGPVPTPTDAIFMLGIGEGGDPEKAREAIQSVADALGTDLQDAANRIVEQACRTILDEAGSMIDRINAKPVYTVHELWEGHRLQPRQILVLGGPAPWFATGLERLSESRVTVVPRGGGQCHRRRSGPHHLRGDLFCRFGAGNRHCTRKLYHGDSVDLHQGRRH